MKYECDITIEPGDADKRQTLTRSLDFAIMTAGMRIRAGTYRVTIERLKTTPPQEQEPES